MALALLSTAIPTAASAAVCDTLNLGDEAQEVLIGHYGSIGTFNDPMHGPQRFFIAKNDLGICWRDAGGSWHAERLACDASSSAGDEFRLDVAGGDDYVTTLLPQHAVGIGPTHPNDFVRVGSYTGTDPNPDPLVPRSDYAFDCGGAAIAPWPAQFSFSMHVDLGEGGDTYHGGPARDRVASNFAELVLRWVGWPLGFVSEYRAPADGSLDLLCGGDGDDVLLGDHDNDYAAGAEERLDGEGGNDECDGDPYIDADDDDPSADLSDITPSRCEVRDDGWNSSGSDTYFDCSASANPFDVIDW